MRTDPPFPGGADDVHVFFTKRTPVLEWDKQISVISYDWTAWNFTEGEGGSLDLDNL